MELSGPGVQYIADNQLYNSIITAHAILMRCDNVFDMRVPVNLVGTVPPKGHNKSGRGKNRLAKAKGLQLVM
jgi:hypothetical protein